MAESSHPLSNNLVSPSSGCRYILPKCRTNRRNNPPVAAAIGFLNQSVLYLLHCCMWSVNCPLRKVKTPQSLEEYYIYRRTVTSPRINRTSVNPPVGPHCLLTTSRRTWVWLRLELGQIKSPPQSPNWLDYIFMTAVSPPTAVCFKSKLVSKRPKGNVFKSLWISALRAFIAFRWISLVCPCLYSRDQLCFPVSWSLMSGAQLRHQRYQNESLCGNQPFTM